MPEFNPEVLWEEGMLLKPQHLQAFQHHCVGLVNRHSRSRPFGYGVRELEILKEGVADWTFEIRSCEIVMPDGSLVIKDQTALIEPVEFRHLEREGPNLDVWLALPFMKSEGRNILRPGAAEEASAGSGARYVAGTWRQHDETSGSDPEEIAVKRFNARVFVGTRPPQGHVTLKIARLQKVVTDDSGVSRYELSPDFVPACLTMDASPVLAGVVKDLLFRLEEKNKSLLARLRRRRDLLSGDAGEPATLLKLQATNGVLPILRQLAGQAGMHPFDVFIHLSRLIGDLAIFAEDWEPPKLVLYDQDDPLKAYLDLKGKWLDFLERAVETRVGKRVFRESAELSDALEVEIPPAFLEQGATILLGVRTTQEPFRVLKAMGMARLAAPGDMEECRRKRTAAIRCLEDPDLDPALRNRDGMVFLRVDQEGARWEAARKAKRLALDTRTTGDFAAGFELFATGVHMED